MTRDELATLLIEECAEVTKAMTKIVRFGWDRTWPGYGNNREELSKEIGDLLGVIDALQWDLNPKLVADHRRGKILKAEKWKKYFETHPEDGPQDPNWDGSSLNQ